MNLVTLTLTALAIALQHCNLALAQEPQKCTDMRVRRSAHSLSATDWENIRNVLSKMHDDGQFDRFAGSHQTVFDQVHGNSVFFPFHRKFVLEFEDVGRKIDPNFTVPFWDSTLDYRDPASSPVLQDGTLGSNGVAPSQCLTTGIQGNWQMGFPDQHCIQRAFDGGNSIRPWIPPEIISSYIQQYRALSDFREHIEYGIHGVVHVGLGGDAYTKYAPNDFFFHMHHANLDRLWWVWQNTQNAFFNYNGNGPTGRQAMLNDEIPQDSAVNFGGVPVRSVMVLGYNGVCYTYEDGPGAPGEYPSGASSTKDQLVDSQKPANTSSSVGTAAPAFFSGSSDQAKYVLEESGIRQSLSAVALSKYFPKLAAAAAAPSMPPSSSPPKHKVSAAKARKIAYPRRMPKTWIRMHGLDPRRVEAVYKETRHLIALLNNSTYVSPY
ncbi:hypothetical protein GGI12_001151 [Dipsacomyces acuminosporus]|nr:hypothetical protein GGI12_001151 [Dipsacomyces acuminosporus]